MNKAFYMLTISFILTILLYFYSINFIKMIPFVTTINMLLFFLSTFYIMPKIHHPELKKKYVIDAHREIMQKRKTEMYKTLYRGQETFCFANISMMIFLGAIKYFSEYNNDLWFQILVNLSVFVMFIIFILFLHTPKLIKNIKYYNSL